MFYILDKPINLRSRELTEKIIKNVGAKKGGHSGTLDPFASGLIIIATNSETKFLDRLLSSKKTYTGKILFGKTTNTLDIDGIVSETKEVDIQLDKLKKIINEKFIGKINQVPPKVSSKKINGKHAYDLERNNIDFELKPIKKIIFSFEIEQTKVKNEFSFRVEVSSGTYIRALARDLGLEFDAPAMLTELRRIKIGNIDIKDSITLDEVEKLKTKTPFKTVKDILKIEEVEVEDKFIKLLLEGKRTNMENHQLNDQEYIFIGKLNKDKLLVNQVGKNTFKLIKRIS